VLRAANRSPPSHFKKEERELGHTGTTATADNRGAARLLTASEVAGVLGVRRTRVYALLASGTIPVVHVGRQVRVAERVLYEWIEAGGQALPGGWKR